MPEPSLADYLILLYHGVSSTMSEGIENFSGKHVSVDEFEKQISFVRKNLRPIDLRTFAQALASGVSPPQGTVAVTFDDCYKNVHDVALPILRQYQVPATFFVSTGFIGTNRRFWTDCLEHMISRTRNDWLDMDLGAFHHRFDLSSAEGRKEAVVQVKHFLKRTCPADRHVVMQRLKNQLGVDDNGDEVPNYANLSWEDVCDLDAPPQFAVGGHTVNHEILSYLSDEELRFEVWKCKEDLEVHLGHSVDLFSYPEGQAEHFDQRVISELKRAGITICPSAMSGANHEGADPFYFKRNMVGFMGERFPFDGCEG